MKSAEENDAGKIVAVCLRIGELRDFVEEVTQKYWDFLSVGTIAEGAKIRFERVPASVICHHCENVFRYDWRRDDKPCCPSCGESDSELYAGMELEIKEITITS